MNKRNFLLLTLLMMSISALAQDGINVPYSQYGLGLGNSPYNQAAASAIGGAVITRADNNIVNPFNPASYAAIEKESFVFDMGFNFGSVSLKDANNKFTDADGSLGYISVAFPLTKWWKTSLSLLPLSDVCYSSVNTVALPGVENGTVKTTYGGTGGVSRLIWGHAFNVIPQRLSVGMNANYYYGYMSREINYMFDTPDSLPQYMNVIRQRVTQIRNFSFDFGLQYFQPIMQDYQLGIGLTLATPHTMNVTDNALVRTFVMQNGSPSYRDTIFPASGENPEYTSTMELPMQVGLGLSFQRNHHWRIAVDGSYAPWSGVKYTDKSNLFGYTCMSYGNNFKGALGFQLLGNPDASSYARRITYSAGVHYESGKLRLLIDPAQDEEVLNEWGLGMGVSLPMRKGKSVLTLSCNYSSFGTPDLLRQNAFTIGMSVSSCESWFVKRKYN